MALFGKARDIHLFNSLNTELLKNIVTQQVGYYKVSLAETKINMYGEATEKYVSDPLLIECLIERGPQRWKSDEFGSDVDRTMEFRFFRQHLLDVKLVPEVGDYIFWYENYFEVDSVVESQYFMGKKPEYSYSEGLDAFGSSISILCNAHLVPADKLGISIER